MCNVASYYKSFYLELVVQNIYQVSCWIQGAKSSGVVKHYFSHNEVCCTPPVL